MTLMTPVRRGGLGTGERIGRGFLGGAAVIAGIAGWLTAGGWFAWAWFAIGLLGVDFVITAVRAYCPLYAYLGLGRPYVADLFKVRRSGSAGGR